MTARAAVIGLGALALAGSPKLSPAVSPQPSRSLWQILLPYAIIPALGLLLLYVWWTPGNNTLAAGVYVGTALLIGQELAARFGHPHSQRIHMHPGSIRYWWLECTRRAGPMKK